MFCTGLSPTISFALLEESSLPLLVLCGQLDDKLPLTAWSAANENHGVSRMYLAG